jgi:phage terminase large subunit-like protein
MPSGITGCQKQKINNPSYPYYKAWHEAGLIHECSGNTNDFDMVIDHLRDEMRKWKVREIPHDQHLAVDITNKLLPEGFPLTEFSQKATDWTPPMDELESAVGDGCFHYNGDPILAWAVSNVVCHRDRNDQLFPVKESLDLKIDPAQALFMSVARVMNFSSVRSSGGGSITVIGNCQKCTALCLGTTKGDNLVFLCDKCQ